MADEVIRGLNRIVDKCVDDKIHDLRKVVEKLLNGEQEKNAQIEKLKEQVGELTTEFHEKKRKAEVFTSGESVEKLTAEMKEAREQIEKMTADMATTKESVSQVNGTTLQSLNTQIQGITMRLNAINPQAITTQLQQLATRVNQVNPQVLTTQMQQLTVKVQQAQQHTQQLANDTNVAITQLKAQGLGGGGGGGLDPVLGQKVSQAFSRVDQNVLWMETDLENQDSFQTNKVYRLQSGDGWIYSSVVQANCIYMFSPTTSDQVVVLFASNKKLPMQRSVGAAIETMKAHPSGRLQCRGT